MKEKLLGIKVLEIRNYLLQPHFTDKFSRYFHQHFVAPMRELKGYTLGEFAISGVDNRFVWFRGFTDMKSRLQFLNDFYLESETWKEYGKTANEMMINSDHVYLLKPLYQDEFTISDKEITVVDFYVCNNTLERTITFFDQEFTPYLRTKGLTDISFWVSEMSENDFPRLPVFQDKNLLLSITNYSDGDEYEEFQNQIRKMPESLNRSFLELVTIHNHLKLVNLDF